jgi:hypothetical protein
MPAIQPQKLLNDNFRYKSLYNKSGFSFNIKI